MYVFGGMCGARLDDLWQLDLGKLNLIQAQELVMIDQGKYKNCFENIFEYSIYCIALRFITSTCSHLQEQQGCDVNGC